jgi:hypothetical protein
MRKIDGERVFVEYEKGEIKEIRFYVNVGLSPTVDDRNVCVIHPSFRATGVRTGFPVNCGSETEPVRTNRIRSREK